MRDLIKVVIIDDEALVRMGLKSMIRWEELGFELAGEAVNGQQGVEVIANTSPDIVITDIKMPILDGLDMIRQIHESGKKVRFIVLSSFDEFALVRQAMKLGAEEYLIKLELEPEVLVNALSAVAKKIRSEQEETDKRNRLERHIRVNKPVLREEFFKKLISKTIYSDAEIEDHINYLEVDLDSECLVCAMIKVNDLDSLSKYKKEDMQLFDFSVVNITDEIVNQSFRGYSFKYQTGEYFVVLSPKEQGGNLAAVKVDHMAQRLIQMLKQYMNISVNVGISSRFSSLKELYRAYRECSRTIQHGFFTGPEKYLHFSQVKEKEDEYEKLDLSTQREELAGALQMGDVEAVQLLFADIVGILEERRVSKEQAYDICCQIAYQVVGNIKAGEEVILGIAGCSRSLFESIAQLGSLTEITSWLKKLENGLCIYLSRNEDQQNHRLVSKAKKFIHDHYAEDISLQEISAVLNISPSYFSTIFKQYVGVCFTDYMTEVKIQQAKKLLSETNLKIYEVADKLGYENAYYFARVFKKVTGITPSDFINKNIK